MGLLQYIVAVLLSAHLVLTLPATQRTVMVGGRDCGVCPPGKYQTSCTQCAPCPAGSYTAKENREDSCHHCYGDCTPAFNLKVVQNCTSTSDLKCVCEAGYRCIEKAPYTDNCRECVKIQDTTTTEAAAAGVSDKDKQTPSTASSGHSSTSPKPCQFPKCGPQPVLAAENGTHPKPDRTSSHLAAILCPVVVIGCVALLILLCVRRTRDETCFRQTIAKLCNEEGQDTSHKLKESTHQFPRDSFSAKQQLSPLSATNLGPVHVHNPGTVIFSLLSQFTGQVGPTIEGGKMAERVSSEEEDERRCPVFHPPSSPSVHLSEEERSGEIDSIFFPSQEQGKDCHVSKEEAL